MKIGRVYENKGPIFIHPWWEGPEYKHVLEYRGYGVRTGGGIARVLECTRVRTQCTRVRTRVHVPVHVYHSSTGTPSTGTGRIVWDTGTRVLEYRVGS